MTDFPPEHPGRILRSEFLEPLGISEESLAHTSGIPPSRISEILDGRRKITAETGLRLSKALGLSDSFWINMQARYDADKHAKMSREIEVGEHIAIGPLETGPGYDPEDQKAIANDDTDYEELSRMVEAGEYTVGNVEYGPAWWETQRRRIADEPAEDS